MAEGFPRLPSNIEMTPFRALPECLISIHRHSRCTIAKIRLEGGLQFRPASGTWVQVMHPNCLAGS